MRHRKDKKTNTINHICEYEGCTKPATHRAPKNRNLNEHYHFCLEHVTQYNKNWNFYQDLSPEEIEQHIKNDTTWQRPTWKLGESMKHNHAQSVIKDSLDMLSSFGMGMDGKHNPPAQSLPINDELAAAIKFLQVQLPLDITIIKKQYKILAKKYHPDTNKNNENAESQFKELHKHYKYLIDFIKRNRG